MNKQNLQKTLILSGLVLWLVVILLEGEITEPHFIMLENLLKVNNTNIIKGLCFFLGGLNIMLGTVLIDDAIMYIPVIITFLFLDYGLTLSCIKAIYEVITLNNSIVVDNPTATINAV